MLMVMGFGADCDVGQTKKGNVIGWVVGIRNGVAA